MPGEDLFHKITNKGDNAGYNTLIRGYAQYPMYSLIYRWSRRIV